MITDSASAAAYSYLSTELARLTVGSGVTLNRFSYLDFFSRVGSDPASLALTPLRTDITYQSAGTAVIAAGWPGIFSFDGTHPTAAVQQALFSDINRQFALTPALAAGPETATWSLMIAGLGAVGFAMRRRHRVSAAVNFA